jgi:hypothetical protein
MIESDGVGYAEQLRLDAACEVIEDMTNLSWDADLAYTHVLMALLISELRLLNERSRT